MSIRRMLFFVALAIVVSVPAVMARAQDEKVPPYTQTKDVVYADVDGIGLLMDIFTPTGPSNGLGIVDVASGAWHSDRGKINDHKRAQMFDIFCGRGYTVFAVRPGSISRFSLADMAVNVKKGITWVKDHAEQYKIDPNRLALCGASAGGHLASLVAVTADDKTAVKAVGVFFPPTDFLDFRGMKVNENSSEDALAAVSRFVLPPHTKTGNAAKMLETLKAVSPAHNVTSKAPPFLIIHGDKDPLVPLNQSERLLAALQANGVPAELIVKKGGAHPWPTIHEEVKVIADWLDKQLASK